jgi:anti-sigma B factor antagonist
MSDTLSRRLIELGGDIDLANAPPLGDALCNAIDRNRCDLLVDVSAVPFMDSSAMKMLIRVHRHAEAIGHTVTWRGVQEHPAYVLKITGLDGLIHIID